MPIRPLIIKPRRETKSSRHAVSRDRKGERVRLAICLFVFVLVWIGFGLRLWNIQISHAEEYQAIAQRQSSGKAPLPAVRGVVYDRAGREVAMNVIRYSVCVYPTNEDEAVVAGKYLDRIFGERIGVSRKKYSISPKKFRWIKRGVDEGISRQIRADQPAGVFIREEQEREYPFALIGKQILGFTDIDNIGISGVERRFDSLLKGVDGMADIQRNGLSKTYRIEEAPLVQPQSGRSVILTVDWEFQEVVEEELKTAVEKNKAMSGAAVFVDCRTGEILAAAHYDPTEENRERPVKLRAITDCFEPGSIYKVITAAAVLDHDIMSPDAVIYCENGKWKCGHRILNDDHKHGDISFREVIELSSNIGTAKAAILLGGARLAEMSRRFGIGQRTRVDFPGEQSGRLNDGLKWSDYNVGALSIGHSVSLTPLHMAMVMGAVANGGELLQPRFVRGVVGPGGLEQDFREPEIIGRTMRETTAATLRDILRGVVTVGTAMAVNSPIIGIAGKTGTAEVPLPSGRGYMKNKFCASFAGFFPLDSPQVAGIVMLSQPEPVHYGGLTSGPAFRAMAERFALANPGRFSKTQSAIAVAESVDRKNAETPHLVGLTRDAAVRKAAQNGVLVKGTLGDGDVVWQYPAGGTVVPGQNYIVAQVVSDEPPASVIRTPDMVGFTLREAALLIQRLGLRARISGVGRVINQEPAPGSRVDSDSVVRILCQSARIVAESINQTALASTAPVAVVSAIDPQKHSKATRGKTIRAKGRRTSY